MFWNAEPPEQGSSHVAPNFRREYKSLSTKLDDVTAELLWVLGRLAQSYQFSPGANTTDMLAFFIFETFSPTEEYMEVVEKEIIMAGHLSG